MYYEKINGVTSKTKEQRQGSLSLFSIKIFLISSVVVLNSLINKISLVTCLQKHNTLPSSVLLLTICPLNMHTHAQEKPLLMRATSLFVQFAFTFSSRVMECMCVSTGAALQYRLSVLCWINPLSTYVGRI